MTRRWLAVALVLLAAVAQSADVAGTVTITEQTFATVKKVTFAWTSGQDAYAGTATGTTTLAYDGELLALVTDPGTAAPTDDYDIAVNDAGGHDVLLGAGANRDTANTEYVAKASLGAVGGSALTISITNAGSAKEGVAVLYLR